MKKRIELKIIVMLCASMLLLSACSNKTVETTEPSTSISETALTEDKLKINQENTKVFVSIPEKIHAVQSTKNFKPISKIKTDKNIVKGLIVDDSS